MFRSYDRSCYKVNVRHTPAQFRYPVQKVLGANEILAGGLLPPTAGPRGWRIPGAHCPCTGGQQRRSYAPLQRYG